MKAYIGPYNYKKGTQKVKIEFQDYDLWNLDHTLATIIHAGLVAFKKMGKQGVPAFCFNIKSKDISTKIYNIDTNKKEYRKAERVWKETLDSWIWLFDEMANETELNEICKLFGKKAYTQKKKLYDKKIKESFASFAQNFECLWD